MFSGKRLRELRKSYGMTQTELGELILVGKSTISQYERGVNVPDVKSIAIFAKYFGVSADYLLETTDTIFSSDNYICITNDDGFREITPIPPEYRKRLLTLLQSGIPELFQKNRRRIGKEHWS